MTETDVHGGCLVMRGAFRDLARRLGGESQWGEDLSDRYPRVRHLIATDPGGAWVAEAGGEVVGMAQALVREGLWGLSVLVVLPEHQGTGVGRELLERALGHGADARGGLIMSSEDPQALRAYGRAGFSLRPAMDAVGPVRRRPPAEPAVRRGRWPEDRELCDAASRFVRGAAHGEEVPVYLDFGCELYVHEGGGFALRHGGDVKLIAAHEPEQAAALLRAILHDVPDGADAAVEYIAAGQDWAAQTAHDAGLGLRPAGAIMVRGDVGPLAPYLPSGTFL